MTTDFASTALLTDQYELTMIDAALNAGTADRDCVFELFARKLPAGRRYGVVAGVGRALEALQRFRFRDSELEFLRERGIVRDETLSWLADYRFTGNIRGYREGELFFPNSPLLEVHAGFAEGVILETLLLSIYNYDSAVASAASRMVSVAQGRPLAEMGSRRTGEHSAVAASRAAYIAGFDATSNLEAGRTWGVPTMGTAAHSFTLLHDTERDAFVAQLETLGVGTTLLVDTYDVGRAIELAIEVAGPGLGGVRLDSGDLPTLVAEVRAHLDALGATSTKITVTNDLDEFAIAGLSSAPVDSYGVGTSVVTGSGAVASGMVYKLVARRDEASGEWVSVAKASTGKVSIGGVKHPVRRRDERGVATAELVGIGDASVGDGDDRELAVDLVTDGVVDERWLGAAGVAAAREHCAAVIAELPLTALRLRAGDPALSTVFVDGD
ncbi:nicotinate phosphoribosyltransferase [Pseudoclavibacter endophyticus]|uniref:Nicotinate phosphoribosyltransferase n=1 Tax=Pseudoclavibacter endophyticus TaxID=1778590 RepID=A0A6H9WLV9_9MICO|nr:nicotinate phosphoribosyltransferase [Pseudoclavibacter endophyticus]KAB1649816.1 nicotinate phosphoribosyltransferase [Pseudoclavibacter endophyticus]GGA59533.1 nicotinate phosphoribosyltransferase [Pseudoclavibacter endophyticus]